MYCLDIKNVKTINLIITYFFKVSNSGFSLKAYGKRTHVLDPKQYKPSLVSYYTIFMFYNNYFVTQRCQNMVIIILEV